MIKYVNFIKIIENILKIKHKYSVQNFDKFTHAGGVPRNKKRRKEVKKKRRLMYCTTFTIFNLTSLIHYLLSGCEYVCM